MDRQYVRSSNLRSIGYDPDTMILEIEFRSGSIYQYFNVPEKNYLAFVNAVSKGSYFINYIKDHYKYKHIR